MFLSLPICFLVLFLIVGIRDGKNVKKTILKSVLVFSTLLLLITEITSAFHLLNYRTVLISWTVITLACIAYLVKRKSEVVNYIAMLRQQAGQTLSGLSKIEKLTFISSLVILVLVFIQGLVYPPNNWDSMTYHMARIPHWISNQSVEHFPTHIFRQVYQPPFSEFVIMHVNMLSTGDYFSNAMQFFYYIFSLIALVSITGLIGFSRRQKFIVLLLAVTLPEAIMQASSTQNDIVVAFFILSSIYFIISVLREFEIESFLYLGMSIGLAMLTKATSYIYLLPVLLIFAIAIFNRVIKTKKIAWLTYAGIAAIIALSFNAGHFLRNYQMSGSVLGVDEEESKLYSNEEMSPKILASNIIKNTALHFRPSPVNRITDKVVEKLHDLIGTDLNNSKTNFRNIEFSSSRSNANHEDSASNPVHFLLIFLSFILVLFVFYKKKNTDRMVLLLMAVIIIQAVLFCAYLKWQPWHSRLQMSIFMIAILLVGYAAGFSNKLRKIIYLFIPVLLGYVLLIVVFNNSRPFISTGFTARAKITSTISVKDDRFKKYFANTLYTYTTTDMYEEYRDIYREMLEQNDKNIGLIPGNEDWEYPLFKDIYTRDIHPYHLKVENITRNIPQNLPNIDCIVSTVVNEPSIEFQGKQYINQDPGNTVVWLYR